MVSIAYKLPVGNIIINAMLKPNNKQIASEFISIKNFAQLTFMIFMIFGEGIQ